MWQCVTDANAPYTYTRPTSLHLTYTAMKASIIDTKIIL